ncbi:hypothetical protein CPB97_003059, partial [Podila verticillata]
MTDKNLTLFCIVDGESVSHAFQIKNIPLSDDVDDLKDAIKAKKTNDFSDVDANNLVLWRVTIPNNKKGSAITPDDLEDKTKLADPTAPLSALSLDNNIYVIVQRPLP